MKYILQILSVTALVTSPVMGGTDGISPETRKDIEVILKKGLLNRELTETAFQGLAAMVAMEMDSSIGTEELLNKLYAELDSDGGLDQFVEAYTKHFTPEEMHRLREIYEDVVFSKLGATGVEIGQSQFETVRKILSKHAKKAAKLAKKLSNGVEPLAVDEQNFAEEVEQSSKPVILDIYADWCGPCRMLAPVLAELNGELGADYKFAKLDADANAELIEKYDVQSLPTLLFIKNGEVVGRISGLTAKADLQKKIDKLLG